MPIYEYTCDKCGRTFELLLASRSAKASCPDCGSSRLTRLFSTFAAHDGSAASPCAEGKCPGSGPSSCAGGGCPFA